MNKTRQHNDQTLTRPSVVLYQSVYLIYNYVRHQSISRRQLTSWAMKTDPYATLSRPQLHLDTPLQTQNNTAKLSNQPTSNDWRKSLSSTHNSTSIQQLDPYAALSRHQLPLKTHSRTKLDTQSTDQHQSSKEHMKINSKRQPDPYAPTSIPQQVFQTHFRLNKTLLQICQRK